MSREAELDTVREQASILAEQVFCLVEVISWQAGDGSDTTTARSKRDTLENLMWKLHARQNRLRNLLH